MSLNIDLKHLEKGARKYKGLLLKNRMETRDDLMKPASDLAYDFEVELIGRNLFLKGIVQQVFGFLCARCLSAFEKNICINDWNRNISLFDEDTIMIENACFDLTPILCEDMLLALPQHPLCEKDCRGLKGMMNEATSQKSKQVRKSTWAALDELHLDDQKNKR